MQPVFVIQEYCPTPCGEVVLLKRRDTGALIGFCAICGAGWSDPRSASIDPHLDISYDPDDYAPAGVDFPAWSEVVSVGLCSIVVRTIESAEWNGRISEANRFMLGEDEPV